MKGFCVWLTGLSGSGKTTLALLLGQELRRFGHRVEVMDEDELRAGSIEGRGCTFEERRTDLLRMACSADLLSRDGVVVIVAAMSPCQSVRDEIRKRLGEYVEIFIDAPLDVCIQRDPKGLYARALAGEIKHLAGLDDPFEPPNRPEIIVPTYQESPQDSLARIIKGLEILGRLPAADRDGLTPEEAELIEKRLRALGYL